MPLSQDQVRALQAGKTSLPPGTVAPTYLTWLGPTDDDVNWTSGPDQQIMVGSGTPNAVVFAPKGTLYVDHTAPALYQNTDGVKAWSQVGAGGASSFPINEDDGTYTFNIDSINANGDIKAKVTADSGSVLQADLVVGHSGITIRDLIGSGALLSAKGSLELDSTSSGGIQITDGGSSGPSGGINIHEKFGGTVLIDAISTGPIELRTTSSQIKLNAGAAGVLISGGATGGVSLTTTGDLSLSESGRLLVGTTLPSSDPAHSGQVWTNGGTLMVSP